MRSFFILVLGLSSMLTSCSGDKKGKTIEPTKVVEEEAMVMLPDSLESLGEALFFEKMLSSDRSVSCASCHIPEYGFADTVAFSRGVNGALGARNTPSVTNMSDRSYYFYDGRAATLEDQVHFPVEDPNEMNFTLEEGAKRLAKDRVYLEWFDIIFNEQPSPDNIAEAIAAYERTLETSNSLFDKHSGNDFEGYLNDSQLRGLELFNDPKSKCFDCHNGPDFTTDEFRNIGLYDSITRFDLGRYNITQDTADLGKFRVPGLRNIGATAPYMHDGSFATLREVLEYYNNPYDFVEHPIGMDSLMLEPLGLTEQELVDLENFLLSLTDERFLKK